jgi:NADPH2:quinone reductase
VRGAQIVDLGSLPQAAELAAPTAADGEVLVTIEAVALNPIDINVGSGAFYGGHPPLPYAPGCEAAGRTEDGSLVYLFGDGCGIRKPGFLAERAAVPSALPLGVPGELDGAVAAAAGIAGVAGWAAARKARIEAGDRVLVLGASGPVGLIALQAARQLGATQVVASGRDPAKLQRARELGADDLVVLGDAEALAGAFGGKGFTVCIDPLWGEPLAQSLAAAALHARVVHIGQSAGGEAPLRSADVRGKELEILGHSNFALTVAERNRLYLELLEHVTAGRITIDVDCHPLDDVAKAWDRQRSGPGTKIVITL